MKITIEPVRKEVEFECVKCGCGFKSEYLHEMRHIVKRGRDIGGNIAYTESYYTANCPVCGNECGAGYEFVRCGIDEIQE